MDRFIVRDTNSLWVSELSSVMVNYGAVVLSDTEDTQSLVSETSFESCFPGLFEVAGGGELVHLEGSDEFDSSVFREHRFVIPALNVFHVFFPSSEAYDSWLNDATSNTFFNIVTTTADDSIIEPKTKREWKTPAFSVYYHSKPYDSLVGVADYNDMVGYKRVQYYDGKSFKQMYHKKTDITPYKYDYVADSCGLSAGQLMIRFLSSARSRRTPNDSVVLDFLPVINSKLPGHNIKPSTLSLLSNNFQLIVENSYFRVLQVNADVADQLLLEMLSIGRYGEQHIIDMKSRVLNIRIKRLLNEHFLQKLGDTIIYHLMNDMKPLPLLNLLKIYEALSLLVRSGYLETIPDAPPGDNYTGENIDENLVKLLWVISRYEYLASLKYVWEWSPYMITSLLLFGLGKYGASFVDFFIGLLFESSDVSVQFSYRNLQELLGNVEDEWMLHDLPVSQFLNMSLGGFLTTDRNETLNYLGDKHRERKRGLWGQYR